MQVRAISAPLKCSSFKSEQNKDMLKQQSVSIPLEPDQEISLWGGMPVPVTKVVIVPVAVEKEYRNVVNTKEPEEEYLARKLWSPEFCG